jgi:replicative DNA helicase
MEEESDFQLTEESLLQGFTQTIEELNRPNNKIKTGVKLLNKMLNGGFEAGRLYLYIAVTGGFKSGFLLTCLKWFKLYNPGIVTRDPTKIPCVMYVSQENSQSETMKRWYAATVPLDQQGNLKDLTPEQVVAKLKKFGSTCSNDPSSPDNDVFFRYRSNKSINTAELDAMIDEYASLYNREVVFIVHDYIKRIKSSEKSDDLRIELGNISNEFKAIAVKRKIPVLTATQVNKMTIGRLAEISANGTDVAKNMSLADIGESGLIAENVDCVIAGYLESDSKGNKYLGLQRLKLRDQDHEYSNENNIEYFAQPFERIGDAVAGMRIYEDIYDAKPSGILSLADGLEGNDTISSNVQARTSKGVSYKRNSSLTSSAEESERNYGNDSPPDDLDDIPL